MIKTSDKKLTTFLPFGAYFQVRVKNVQVISTNMFLMVPGKVYNFLKNFKS